MTADHDDSEEKINSRYVGEEEEDDDDEEHDDHLEEKINSRYVAAARKREMRLG